MRRSGVVLLVVVGIILGGECYLLFWTDSPDLANYKRIQLGMTVEQVRAILGPGSAIDQAEVPGIVVAKNPADVEKARRSGGAVPTARTYPTRIKPVVEGDYILRWKNRETYECILVAFRDGKVCEKYYWDPNYF